MSKKNMLFLSLIVACLVIGRFARVLWNSTTAKGTATTEKSVEVPVTNRVYVNGINPVIMDSK